MAASTTAMIGVLGHAKRATQWENEEQTQPTESCPKRGWISDESNGRDTIRLTSRAEGGNNKRKIGRDKGSMVRRGVKEAQLERMKGVKIHETGGQAHTPMLA